MQATGTLKTKIVMRRLPHSTASQMMLLCGFTSTLSHVNADYVETLSPNNCLTQTEIDGHVSKFMKMSNASGSDNITNPSVQRKLDKLFGYEVNAEPAFANMGIGEYLPGASRYAMDTVAA